MPSHTVRTKVAGVSHGDRQKHIADLIDGQDLQLEREPDNAHDPDAVVVYHGRHSIGYLPRHMAAEIAPVLDEGGWASARVIGITGGTGERPTLGVNIEVEISMEKGQEGSVWLSLLWPVLLAVGLVVFAVSAC